MQALSASVQAASGIAIRYRRGPLAEAITATVGQTVYELESDIGLRRVVSADFLIPATDFPASLTEPQDGDVIEQAEGGQVYRYSVASPDGGPCWRYSDTFHATMRIHTTRIGQAVE